MEFRNIFMGVIMLGLVLAIIFMAAIKPEYEMSIQPAQDVLTVSGSGEVTTMPDKAEIYINVFTMAGTAEEAKDSNSETSALVIKALKDEGIKKDDIETYSFNLYPKKKYVEEEETYIITGYEARHVLKVTTQKIDDVGGFVDLAVAAGANSIDRIKFDLTTETREALEREALKKAIDLAKARAEAMADAAGVSLKKIVSIDGSSSHAPFFMPKAEMEMAFGGVAEEATEILPQTLEVTSSAKLVYEIE